MTGTSGRHIYFEHPGRDVRNSAGKLGLGLDVRGDGGYVLLPGSVHRDTGRVYEWEVLHHPDEVPLAPVPLWLLALMTEAGGRTTAVTADARIPEGQRNTTLASLAGSMRRRGMSQSEIEAALLEENAVRCNPPLPDDEVRRIAGSVARYEPAPPSGNGRKPGSVGGPDMLGFPLTDLGNAERLVRRHGHDLRFVRVWGVWLIWDGRRWAEDNTGGIERRAKETVRAMASQAAAMFDTAAQGAQGARDDDHGLRLVKLARERLV